MRVMIKNRMLSILISLAMAFTMMPMLGQAAHGYVGKVELGGGSYTLTSDNELFEEKTGQEIDIHSDQDIVFNGDTVIDLDGHKLQCASLKSGFNNPGANEHPWYTYDLTIDGGDEGGSIQIGSSTKNDHTLAANNLTIRNLDEESSVECNKSEGSKYATYAQNDLLIEKIKNTFEISGANGAEAYYEELTISDVSGNLIIDARDDGISTDSGNIIINRSNVFMKNEDDMHSCISPGWKKGVNITDSFVVQYSAFTAYGPVEIKDSVFYAVWEKEDCPAAVIGDQGKLIISGESLVGFQNAEGAGVSALMTNDIELKDGNRLFTPKDGHIGTTTYDGGSCKTVFKKDGSAADSVFFGSGKEVVSMITAPSKVLAGQPVHMSGVLNDEDGNPVPNAKISIACEKGNSVQETTTDEQGRWEYAGERFTFEDPGEQEFTISVDTNVDVLTLKDMVRYLPLEDTTVNVQVIDSGSVETLVGLELDTLPEGATRKTEYKCGEKFDLDNAYIKAKIKHEDESGANTVVSKDLDPKNTIITPAVMSHGTDVVNISYLFEGSTASIEYPVTVSHDWMEATTTMPKTCKGCGATEGEPVAKKANPLAVKGKTTTIKYSKLKKKTQTRAVTKVIKFTKKGQGKMAYTLTSAKKGKKSFKKYFKINKSTGKVTIKKNKKMKKGTYKVKVKVKAAGNSNYNASAWKTVTFKIKVK